MAPKRLMGSISSRNYIQNHTPVVDPGDSSINTAKLRAILLALKHVYFSKEKSFLILTDSLSVLQARHQVKDVHPVLVNIHEYHCTHS